MLFFATEFSFVFFCVVVVVVVGLYEGCIVSCKVVDEVPVLDVVNVTACNEKDWEMLVSEMHKLDLVAVRTLYAKLSNFKGSDQLSNTKYTFGSNENRERRSKTRDLGQQSDEHIR